MATPGYPQFFCTRPDGSLTPLLAADELPSHITIHGVPRIINAGETQGMTSCGLAPRRAEPWSVDGVTQSAEREAGKEPLHDMHGLLMEIITNNNVAEPMRASAQALLIRGIERHDISGEGTPASEMSPITPTFHAKNPQMSNKLTSGSKKEYCSYWIRHGECDYAQQGCLFKHEMPVDMTMIEKLGLRDIPRWYREKYNVPSLLQTGHGGRPHLAITEQMPMRALPSPAPHTESCASKVATVNANLTAKKSPTQFDKSPPRGPANRGGHSGFANYNQHRGARNGVTNGHHANNWKSTHRGGRNRNVGYARPTIISTDRDGGRSGECSPGMGSPRVAFDYGAHGFSGNRVCTPTTPVAVPSNIPINVYATGHPGTPIAAQRSLLDDGNSRNQNAYWPLNELTEYNEDMFEEIPNKPTELRPRRSGHVYQQSSTTSSDGGVMLPTMTYDSNFGAFAQADVSGHKQSSSDSSQGTVKANYESLTPKIRDLHVGDNVPLTAAETRVTWGPIGGPILKRTSPPAEEIPHLFGSFPSTPRGN